MVTIKITKPDGTEEVVECDRAVVVSFGPSCQEGFAEVEATVVLSDESDEGLYEETVEEAAVALDEIVFEGETSEWTPLNQNHLDLPN